MVKVIMSRASAENRVASPTQNRERSSANAVMGCRQLRGQERQPIFALEKGDGGIGQMRPSELNIPGDEIHGESLDLGLSGISRPTAAIESAQQGNQANQVCRTGPV